MLEKGSVRLRLGIIIMSVNLPTCINKSTGLIFGALANALGSHQGTSFRRPHVKLCIDGSHDSTFTLQIAKRFSSYFHVLNRGNGSIKINTAQERASISELDLQKQGLSIAVINI